MNVAVSNAPSRIALLTGGDDKSYVLGIVSSLVALNVQLEIVGSDRVDAAEFHGNPRIRFLNLRGNQDEDVALSRKIVRIVVYYYQLMKYAATSEAQIFHILWNNKFEWFDRTFLMLYYRALRRKVVFTVHNVNAAKRDGTDHRLNRLTLKVQYALCHHMFVHTESMKKELSEEFSVPEQAISVIPFGINNTLPNSRLDQHEARRQLGLASQHKVILFFGQIAPYKGLEFLVTAMEELSQRDAECRLVIAGKVKQGHAAYWDRIQRQIAQGPLKDCTTLRIKHIPDVDVEIYFKAADVLVLPYTSIYQSGLPFLSYSFGLPIVVSDVGAMRENVIVGKTGYVCRAADPQSLAAALRRFFSTGLCKKAGGHREWIRQWSREEHSWDQVARITEKVYRQTRAP